MLNAAPQFVRLFSRLSDGQHCAYMSLNDSAEKLRIQVLHQDGAVYEGSYEESDVDCLRLACNPHLSWSAFFELIQKSFVENTLEFANATTQIKVSLKHERQTDSVPCAPFSSSLLLNLRQVHRPHAAEDLSTVLIRHNLLRVPHDRREQERIDAEAVRERICTEQASQLVEEMHNLRSRIQQLNAAADAAEEEEEAILASLPPEKRAAFTEAMNRIENSPSLINFGVSLVADPLPLNLKYKRVDEDLFRLLRAYPYKERGIPDDHVCLNTLGPPGSLEAEDYCGRSSLHRRVWMVIESLDSAVSAFDAAAFHKDCLALNGLTSSSGAAASAPAAGGVVVLAYYAMYRFGCAFECLIPENTLLSWLSMVEESYNPKLPFHNCTHAVDALQMICHLLLSVDRSRVALPVGSLLALIIATAAIDVRHDGLDNLVHERAATPLSTLFTNSSAVESRSAGMVLQQTKVSRYNILAKLGFGAHTLLTRLVHDFLRATDPAWAECVITAYFVSNQERESTDPRSADRTTIVLSMILLASDIAWCCRETKVYQQWVSHWKAERAQMEEEAVKRGVALPYPTVSKADNVHTMMLELLQTKVVHVFAAMQDLVPSVTTVGGQLLQNQLSWSKNKA